MDRLNAQFVDLVTLPRKLAGVTRLEISPRVACHS